VTPGTDDDVPNRPWSLRRRVTALCLLVAVVLTFLVAGAVTAAVANRGQLDDLLDKIGPMRIASNNLLSALVNQETALRGYVVTGNQKDHDVYDNNLADQQAETSNILNSPAATPQVKERLANVTANADAWHTAVANPAIAAVERGDLPGAQSLINDSARSRFDALRASVQSLQDTMQTIRDESQASIRDTNTTLLFVLIAVAVLGIGGAIGLLIALQRNVIGPLTRLATEVRTVAGGEYSHPVGTIGPPELENLAFDVDQMRLKIASDLAEVTAARRKIEESAALLEAQAAELTRSNRDLEQFAYVASHDLQEPLRKVASFCQLLQRRYQGQLDERADQYIAFAVSGAQRMQRLINDLLAFSRIGRVTSGFSDVDLNRVVAEAAAVRPDPGLLPDGAPPADDEASPQVTWTGLPVIRGEEALLTTLFANLIGNSLKFRRPGVPARVAVSARRLGEAWEISCIDNGIGIEPEYAEKVFVIFQRLHTREAYAGTGIGLAVAKKIVEYHGGTIWVDTSFDGGTAIRFILPMTPIEPAGAAELPAPAAASRDSARREKEPVR
jgi:signal transduction histidine kinase